MGAYREARQVILEAIEQTAGRPVATLVESGDRRALQEAIEQSGKTTNLIHCLELLGDVLRGLGRYDEAKRLLRESLALARTMNVSRQTRRIAFALIHLSELCCFQQAHREASRLAQEALDIVVRTGDRYAQALALRTLGRAASGLEDSRQAQQLHEESLALAEACGWRAGIITNLVYLGKLALAAEDDRRAMILFRDALRAALNTEETPSLLSLMVALAELSIRQGAEARAIELLRLSLGHPACHADTRHDAARLLAGLPETVQPAVDAPGQAADIQALARALLEQFESADDRDPDVKPLVEALTAREREVLRLIVRGSKTRDVAAELVISEGTVRNHRKRIYSKLGVHNRAEAAALARELRLL